MRITSAEGNRTANLRAVTGEEINLEYDYYCCNKSHSGLSIFRGDIHLSLTKYDEHMPDYVKVSLLNTRTVRGKIAYTTDGEEIFEIILENAENMNNYMAVLKDIAIYSELRANRTDNPLEFFCKTKQFLKCTLIYPDYEKTLIDPINNTADFQVCLYDCGSLDVWKLFTERNRYTDYFANKTKQPAYYDRRSDFK